jgi:hypothetical protein
VVVVEVGVEVLSQQQMGRSLEWQLPTDQLLWQNCQLHREEGGMLNVKPHLGRRA